MICDMCNHEVDNEEITKYYGKNLCEDCYIAELHRPKACDPAAVSSAKKSRVRMGQVGDAGLTDLQKKIYNYVKDNEKVEKSLLPEILNIPPSELETQFAVLRHCELLKGQKIDNRIYITTF
ncbi:hypothetical protein GC105_13390 [Alkalibaculum sp. M08DMB]|uniref:Uncharacterized protein n=1 Tax=Alkalibaculum sporogenes TaxID=2655001 RepID=A0A6A7KB55_9FIRM|nr:hypothetical protein [Alkalibaculum sporogenes]MPW26779.1 hypothetical protein [Alkalibaculum sporogenes]